MLAVAASAHASAALSKEEVTLSRGLHTPPLPTTHAPVGYRWQNSECCQPLRGRSTVTSTTSCRTRVVEECPRPPLRSGCGGAGRGPLRRTGLGDRRVRPADGWRLRRVVRKESRVEVWRGGINLWSKP